MTNKVSETLDLRGIPCPQNASRAIIKLEMLGSKEVLEILLDDGEPIENVTMSIEEERCNIIQKKQQKDGHWILLVSPPS